MLHISFFSKLIVFPKTILFIKFVVSLTIFNNNSSLMIVNDDPSLTIVTITVNNFFSKTIIFESNRLIDIL